MSETPEEVGYGDVQDTLGNLGATPEYGSFISAMQRVVNEQPNIPISHLLAVAIMDMFGPSFVLIGSPDAAPFDSTGLHVPINIGIAMNPNTDMSTMDVIHTLKVVAGSMENDIVTSDRNLAKEFPDEH